MKLTSLLAAVAIVLVADSVALMHARANRTGAAEAEIILTQRELTPSYAADDDSGVTLDLQWIRLGSWPDDTQTSWLDTKHLRELGFDTTVPPTDAAAAEFYRRQRPRRAFVALENDGPAWQKWNEAVVRRDSESSVSPQFTRRQPVDTTYLIAIDAGTDPARLRASHPDRQSTIIVPAVIRIDLEPFYAGEGAASRAPVARRDPRVVGGIQEIPSSIHVPLEFSDGFRHLPKDGTARYRVHLRYGASLEPWIVGVDFLPASPVR